MRDSKTTAGFHLKHITSCVLLAFVISFLIPDEVQSSDAEFTVILRDEAPYFNPRRLRVARGSKIVWKNQGPVLTHTILINAASGVARSGSIRPGHTWSYVFGESDDAVVKTSCEIHPYMYGIVIVGDPPDKLIQAVESKLDPNQSSGLLARVLEFSLPVPDSFPGILAIDSEDNVWFTMGGGGFAGIEIPPRNLIGRLTLDGDIKIYSVPTQASGPSGIVVSPDGMVFTTELFGNKIARIDPLKHVIEEHPAPTPDSWPTGLALDGEGNLWFNETKGNKIGCLSRSGNITEFPVPTPGSRSTGLAVDPQGNVWIAEREGNKIGCLRRDGTFLEFSIPTPQAKPTGLTLDSQGRVWFAERQGNKIGVLENGQIREYPLPNPNSGPFSVLVDQEGQVWFTEMFGNRIGMLNPISEKIVEYDLPTKDSWPGGLAMDSQGNLWFSMQLRNKVGVILRTPGGELHSGGK